MTPQKSSVPSAQRRSVPRGSRATITTIVGFLAGAVSAIGVPSAEAGAVTTGPTIISVTATPNPIIETVGVAQVAVDAIDVDGDPLIYFWTYVGLTRNGACAFGDPTVAQTTFTCADDGIYRITALVSDGNADRFWSAEVVVSDVPTVITVEPIPPTPAGDVVHLTVRADDVGAFDEFSLVCSSIDWGDGTVTLNPFSLDGPPHCSADHVYAAGGRYNITLTYVSSNDPSPAPLTIAVEITAPTGVPGAPTITSLRSVDRRIRASFSPPASDGGLPITGYTLRCVSASGNAVEATGAASPLVLRVRDVRRGSVFSCTVTAHNAIGSGASSTPVLVRLRDDRSSSAGRRFGSGWQFRR